MKLIYLAFLLIGFTGPSGQELAHDDLSLSERRQEKSDRFLELLQDQESSQLKKLLVGYRDVSDQEVREMLGSIEEQWGELSESTEVETEATLNKGDFNFIYHLQLTTTHFGNWYMFSNENPESYLRIGVTFNKDSDNIGGVVFALVPK